MDLLNITDIESSALSVSRKAVLSEAILEALWLWHGVLVGAWSLLLEGTGRLEWLERLGLELQGVLRGAIAVLVRLHV